jgi:hypothetical protein
VTNYHVSASPQYGVASQTDAFFIGSNGQLYVKWVTGAGNWSGPVGLGPEGIFPPGAGVAASPQYGVDNQTDVFAVGNNGQLYVAWVTGAGNWSGPVGLGPEGILPPGAGVAASPQYGVDNQTDVLAVGNNGLLYVAWVTGAGNWSGPVGLIAPPAITLAALQDQDGRFVSVAGQGFTEGGDVSLAYDIEAGGAPTTHETGQTSVQADASGSFTARIDVNLVEVSAANVEATDLTSGRTAAGSLP